MSAKVRACLAFKDQAEDAARFYASLIPGPKLATVDLRPDWGRRPQLFLKLATLIPELTSEERTSNDPDAFDLYANDELRAGIGGREIARNLSLALHA